MLMHQAFINVSKKYDSTKTCHSEKRSDVGIRILKALDYAVIQKNISF